MTIQVSLDNVTIYEIPTETVLIRAYRICTSILIPGGYYATSDNPSHSEYDFCADCDYGPATRSYPKGKTLRLHTKDIYGKWVVVTTNPDNTISAFYDSILRIYRPDGTFIVGDDIPYEKRGIFYQDRGLLMDSEDMLKLTAFLSINGCTEK